LGVKRTRRPKGGIVYRVRLALAACSLITAPASATEVALIVKGTVDQIDVRSLSLSGPTTSDFFRTGDPFELRVTFDTSLIVSDPVFRPPPDDELPATDMMNYILQD